MYILIYRYKIIMDALGVSEPGESAEAEMLIKVNLKKYVNGNNERRCHTSAKKCLV